MALPGLNINVLNGRLGRVAQTDDGIAGLLLTGVAEGSLETGRVYQTTGSRWLTETGVTAANNPLVHKEVTEFYAKAGEGAELYILVMDEQATTLAGMTEVHTAFGKTPVEHLIDEARGRIRLLGLNAIPATQPADMEAVGKAIKNLDTIGDSCAADIRPFRALVPADGLSTPATALDLSGLDYDRVAVIAASDAVFERESGVNGNNTKWEYYPAAIGQVLGTAASIPVNYSIARVKNGVASLTGYLTNGKTVEENTAILSALDELNYTVYRTYPGKNGYYFNDDCMAAGSGNDYSNLNLGRVIDKAVVLAYNAYVDEILDSIEVDENGQIPPSLCVYYQNMLNRAILTTMAGEISSFETYIDPRQNILTSSTMVVSCMIVPKGTLRTININLGFSNPAINQ